MSDIGLIPTLDNINPIRRRIIEDITAAILDEYAFAEDQTIMLDYACGTGSAAIYTIPTVLPNLQGLISQQLAPYCKKVVGIDINNDAVQQYNTAASNQGLSPDEMQAIHSADLTTGLPSLTGQKFDVIVCAQAFHHIPAIADVTKQLGALLVPSTGVLLVVDHTKAEAESGTDVTEALHDPHGRTVAHPGGFTEAEIKSAFDSAGLKNFSFKAFAEFQKKGVKCEMFIAKGSVA